MSAFQKDWPEGPVAENDPTFDQKLASSPRPIGLLERASADGCTDCSPSPTAPPEEL